MSEYKKTFWKRSTAEIITYTEGTLMDIIQLARKDILTLITTIESQKEEIEKLLAEWKENEDIIKRKLEIKQDAVDETMTENQSLKAITELAKQVFKEIGVQYMLWIDNEIDCSLAAENMDTLAENTLSEIERLQNGTT